MVFTTCYVMQRGAKAGHTVGLKNISQSEHSRHRSLTGFMVNLVAGLIAYTFQPKKPSLGLWRGEPGLPVVV